MMGSFLLLNKYREIKNRSYAKGFLITDRDSIIVRLLAVGLLINALQRCSVNTYAL